MELDQVTGWRDLREKNRTAKDLHIIRYFSSFVAVSEGKVLEVSAPAMNFCPLVAMFYKNMRKPQEDSKEVLIQKITDVVEEKIRKFGFFTRSRELSQGHIAVPYGASEMMMYAMKKGKIDAAVVVCDGAGSVIATAPEVVQGIGARMNGLFYTTAIPQVAERLRGSGSHVVFDDARIDQIQALEQACRMGFKNIAVTVNGYQEDEQLEKIRAAEKKYGAQITCLIVCTTGASADRVREIKKGADLVWSCASKEVREIIGPASLLQISEKIPVFVLTIKGLELFCAYCGDKDKLMSLDRWQQYIISQKRKGQRVRVGERMSYVSSARLPVRSSSEPSFQ